MQPFNYSRDLNDISTDRGMRFLAGGTTLLDLMKLEVETPKLVIDINRNEKLRRIDIGDDAVRFGGVETDRHSLPDLQSPQSRSSAAVRG